jgi:hypothetical protein
VRVRESGDGNEEKWRVKGKRRGVAKSTGAASLVTVERVRHFRPFIVAWLLR